jgi:hypothetical protein
VRRLLCLQRLKEALGTTSSDFVNASLLQLQAAARSPFGTVSEIHINAALAMIKAAPKDEIEAALAVQMACTHTAAIASFRGHSYFGFGAKRSFELTNRICKYTSLRSCGRELRPGHHTI